ncbi:MAG: hypothetical protein Q9216_005588 [Gyalolechia sp. 2 TL-2023]
MSCPNCLKLIELDQEANAGRLIARRLFCTDLLRPADAGYVTWAVHESSRMESVVMTAEGQIIMRFNMGIPQNEFPMEQVEVDMKQRFAIPSNGAVDYRVFAHPSTSMYEVDSVLALTLLVAVMQTQTTKVRDVLDTDNEEYGLKRFLQFSWPEIAGCLRFERMVSD